MGEKTGPPAIVSMEKGGKTGEAAGRWTATARETATAPEVGSPPDECPSSRSFLRFGLRSAKWLYGNRSVFCYLLNFLTSFWNFKMVYLHFVV